jgi:LysM repeat protein
MNLTPSHKNSKYASFFLYGKETLVTIAIVILPMIFPETAHASLFSFLSSLVGENVSAQETIATGTSYNSQTLPLLELTPTGALAIADNTLVPFVGPSGSTADIDNQPGSTAISTYVVQSGDTLSEIAIMFDVSVNTIVWANSLGTHPVIQPGETLVILPVSGINYTVKKGDTLASIVKKYGGDVTEVMEYNGLSTDASIAIGDTIMIPDGELGGSSGSASHTPTNFSNGTSPLIPGSSGPAIPGYFACPVHGSWLSQGLHGHNAVDLALGVGNPIYAAADGTVIIGRTGGWNGGYGTYVVISHPNGTETLYAHARKLFVTAGEKVTQGDKIAEIGVTGETTGPHLHFEVRGAANPFVTVKC